jgi:hypothetical protein
MPSPWLRRELRALQHDPAICTCTACIVNARPARSWKFIECPHCEACFRVPADSAVLPPHRTRGALCPGKVAP